MAQDLTATPRGEVARTNGGEATRAAMVYRPDTDIYETGDHIVVVADMPGVAPDDVDITLERRVLTIRGRVPVEAHDGYRRLHAEYGEGDFERIFTISDDVDRDRIEAHHSNGVLTLRLPKAESAKTRRIAVNTA